MGMLRIQITRDPESLNYLRDPKKPFDWGNNDANNSLDFFDVLLIGSGAGGTDQLVYRSKVQTVSNMQGLDVPTAEQPAIRFEDTVAPGPFQLKIGLDKLDPRAFYGRINGICNTTTLAGESINENSVTVRNPARWLNHDWQKHKPNPAGIDTRVAWSAGCFVMPDMGLATIGSLFDQHGYKPGDLIDGVLVMKT